MKYSFIIFLFTPFFIYGQHLLMADLDPLLYPEFEAVSGGGILSWHDPNTWVGGVVPVDNASVTIPNGAQVRISTELDARHKFIHVDGDLYMAINTNNSLKVETLTIGMMGYFRIGLPNYRVDPNKKSEIIFISDNQPIDRLWDDEQVTRGMMSMGTIRVYGQVKSHKLEFQQDINAGQSSITFTNATVPLDWDIGDELVLPGTTFKRDQSFEDEVLKIAGISGNTIDFESPTLYDHIRLNNNQSLHLANLTRNVIFKSESTDLPNQRRGHLMFMNADVKIEHTAVVGLGRTDKSKPLDEITVNTSNGTVTQNGARDNVRGRYAIHFHKNGYGPDVNVAPSEIIGCVVQNTQGWGFVNHSSHVHFEENVCYDFVGSGFVTESGDEIGNFYNNIAIKGTGNGQYRAVRIVFANPHRPQPLSDFAFSGDGFWFQGPAVRAVNNVAANCNGAGMFWFTMGSVEIADNQMIGMDKDAALDVYDAHSGISGWLPRTWSFAPNEVLTADLPILECSDFKGYANLAGFRLRMNNSGKSNAFFTADFDGGDVFGYTALINPAIGTSSSDADRLFQDISDLELWNNEIGMRARYSSKTNFDQVDITNGLRYNNPTIAYPAVESHHQLEEFYYNNTTISNYGMGLWIYVRDTDLNNPGSFFNPGAITHVGNDHYDMRDSICMNATSIELVDVKPTSATIQIASHPDLKRMVVRYKSNEARYWAYASVENSNTLEITGLENGSQYTYQVLVGCEFSPSNWSTDKFFSTPCVDLIAGYAIGSTWTYGTFTAPVCLGDDLRIRLSTTAGTSVYTTPNGQVVNGNVNNTLYIYPVVAQDFGIYSVELTDVNGCISNYTFEVIPLNPVGGGYALGSVWTYDTFTAPVCIGDNLRIRLNSFEGTSIYTTPSGQVINGNINNTLFLNPVEPQDFGIYTIEYTDINGCAGIYYFEVISQSQESGAFTTGSVWTSDTFEALACLGDDLRIRLNTFEGTSIYTTPNGQVINGNVNNTLFLNPVEPQDFGTYTIEYTDLNGCVGIYYFEVIGQSQESGQFTTGTVWTTGTFEALACLGDDLRIRLNTFLGTTVYTKPNGQNVNGNVNNTLFVNQVESTDFGIYSVAYTDENNCVSIYHFNVSPNLPDMIPPVAICFPNISVDLDQNGMVVLDVTDIDNGSYDACGLIEVGINSTVLTCADGEEAVVDLLVVEVNGENLSSTCSTQVEINDPFGACCPAVLYVDDDPNLSGLYKATTNVYSDKTVHTSNAVDFRAGQQVNLLAGFEIVSGATFHAYMSPCN